MSTNALPEQALAFYRSPARFQHFRDPGRALGGDAGPLLRLAGGALPEALNMPSGFAGADEWHAAARFFIQQVLLAPGADFYRLLGLSPQAQDVDIKEHHRLLMHLLHPDREQSEDIWQTDAAARINQAYAALREPGKRADYDRQFDFSPQEPRAAARKHPATPALVRRAIPPGAGHRSGDTPLQRYLWRHLPQVSLAGSLVLAAAWVGWIWLNNAPSTAFGGGDDGGTIVALNAPSSAAGLNATNPGGDTNHVAPQVLRARVALADSAPPETSAVAAAPGAAPLAAPHGGANPLQPRVQGMPIANGAARPAIQNASNASNANVLGLYTKAEAAVPARSASPSPDLPTTANRRELAFPTVERLPSSDLRSEPTLPKQSAVDPASVIPQLASRYERGDLEHFMALFHDGARNESGGRSKIRKDYEDVFATTTSRQLSVSEMHWSPKGDTWKGDGRFQARIQRHNENFQRLYNGTLTIEVSAEGNPPLIRSIYHRVFNHSND